MKRFFCDQSGQTTIVIGLALFSICGMAGLAADVGTLFKTKRVLQTAADAGAIAAAAEAKYNNDNTAALAVASLNGVTNGSNGYTVTETITASGYKVVASQAAPTFFMKLFGLSTMNVSATAVGNNGPASGCIYTLDPSGIDVGLTGTGSLTMPDCGVVIDSASSNALNLSGGAVISAQSIGIVGGYNQSNNSQVNPIPVTGIAAASDPLSYITAPSFSSASCLPDPHLTSGANTIGPSVAGGVICYNGLSISSGGTTTMNPGVYVINGGMSMTGSGTVSGSGVTIYLAPPNGSLSLTGSGALLLSAPTSGTYNGILFYQDKADTNSMKVAGSSGSIIQGIFYAPNAPLSLQGASGSQIYADLVVHALSIAGNNTLKNYAQVNTSSPLTTPRLVQ